MKEVTVAIMMGSKSDVPTMEEAAHVLGIDASTLYRKHKRYGL